MTTSAGAANLEGRSRIIRPFLADILRLVSFFPGIERSTHSLLIDVSVFAATEGAPNLGAVLRHQIGHMLGFRHEYLWLDPDCTSQDGRLAIRLANYDVDSVMHMPSCRRGELGGTTPTQGDIYGAIAIYGLSPALIAAVTPP